MLRLFKGMKNIITPAYYASRKHCEKQSSSNGPTVNPVLRKMQSIPCGVFASITNKSDKFTYHVQDDKFRRFCKNMPSLDGDLLNSIRIKQIKSMLRSATDDDSDKWFSEVRMKSKACLSRVSQSISTDKNNKTDRCEDIYQSQCGSKVDNTDVISQIHLLTKRRKSLRGMVKQITIFSLYPNKMRPELPLPVKSSNLFAKPVQKISIIHSIPLNIFGLIGIEDQMPKVKMKENNSCLVDSNLLRYLQTYNRRPWALLGVSFHDKDRYELVNSPTNVYSIEHRSMDIKDQMINEKKLERKQEITLRYLKDGSPRTPLDVDFYSDELPYELSNNPTNIHSIQHDFLDIENQLIDNKIKLERKDGYSDECPRTPLDVDCYNEDIRGLQNIPTSVNFIEQVFMGFKAISRILPLKR